MFLEQGSEAETSFDLHPIHYANRSEKSKTTDTGIFEWVRNCIKLQIKPIHNNEIIAIIQNNDFNN